jgi:hypothetical protein
LWNLNCLFLPTGGSSTKLSFKMSKLSVLFIVLKKGMKPRFNRSNEKLLLVVSDDVNCTIFGVER